MTKKIAIIFAHPDDESVLCGGTLIKAANAGHKITLVCATNGDACETFNKNACATKEKLSKTRQKELKNAAKILGAKHVYYLNYPDGELNKQNTNKAINKLALVLNEAPPDILITFEPNGIVHHPDHITVHRWCLELLKHNLLNKKPSKVYLMTTAKKHGYLAKRACGIIGHDEKDITIRVNINQVHDKKKQAILCHQTQTPCFLREEIIVNDRLNKFFPYEYFIRIYKTF